MAGAPARPALPEGHRQATTPSSAASPVLGFSVCVSCVLPPWAVSGAPLRRLVTTRTHFFGHFHSRQLGGPNVSDVSLRFFQLCAVAPQQARCSRPAVGLMTSVRPQGSRASQTAPFCQVVQAAARWFG